MSINFPFSTTGLSRPANLNTKRSDTFKKGFAQPLPPGRAKRDNVVISAVQSNKSDDVQPENERVYIRDIFKVDQRTTLKNVLRTKGHNMIFKIDRSKYPQVLSNEQVATKNPNANKLIIRDGFHQIVFSAPMIQDEKGPVWVRLKGPVIWPLSLDDKSESKSDALLPDTAAEQNWKQMMKQIFKEMDVKAPEKKKEPLMMDIAVQFSDLSPDGFTEQLELVPTESLPSLWAEKRLTLPEDEPQGPQVRGC